MTPEQYRTQAIMLGIEVAATFLPYVGPAARGGVAVLKAVAFGAARLAFATGIRVSARLAPVLVRLGTVTARLYTVARPVAARLANLSTISARVANYFNCFPAGTPVSTVEGLRNIETIQPGQSVLAFDLVEREWRACRVLETFARVYEGDMSNVTVAGETIQATYLHPFWVVRGRDLAQRPCRPHLPLVPDNATMAGRWVDAADLQVGDELVLRDGRIRAVEAVEHFHFEGMVYNFAVEYLHCYAMGENSVLVHNTNGPISQIISELRRFTRNGFSIRRLSTLRPQGHHIATIYGEVGQELRNLFRSVGVSMESPWNITRVSSHIGPHGATYNNLVLQRLTAAVEGLSGPARRTAFLDALYQLRREIINGDMARLLRASSRL